MKNLKTAAAFALATIPFAVMSPALAGNLDAAVVQPAPAMIAAPTAPPTWAGGYAGAQLGWGWADTDTSDVDTNNDGVVDRFQSAIDGIGEDGDGAIGGLHAGYLWQTDQFVYGGEADFDLADIELDDTNGSLDGIGRLKLKAGYDLGQTLIYATAGAAYGDGEIAGSDYNDWGWLAGAGVDRFVTENVTVGAEVLYHQFDEFDNSKVDVSTTTATVRVGYHF